MKNLKNVLPVFAFVLGLGLVVTQSAFTGKVDPPTHYNAATGTGPADWQPLGTIVIGTGSGEFSCDNDPARDCLATQMEEDYEVVANGELVEN